MKETVLSENTIICRSGSSMSSLLGNATALVRDYLVDRFPKNYIKHVHVDTKDLSEELEEVDVIRKDKPVMVIKPKFDLSIDNRIMGRLPDWSYGTYFIFKYMKHGYIPIFADVERDIYIYALPERMKISFDITITFSTKMEALNAGYYFRSGTRQKSYFYMEDVKMETQIPKVFVEAIADANDIDLSDPDGKNLIVDYLNQNSYNSITRKTNLASGIEQYYFGFPIRVLSIFPDTPEIDDGNQDGMIDKDFNLTTTFEIEFTCPFNYVLEGGKNVKVHELDDEELKYLLKEGFTVNTTFPNRPSFSKEEEVEKKLVMWEGYIADSNLIDIVCLKPVMPHKLVSVIDYYIKNKKDPYEIIEIDLYKGKYKLCRDTFSFDWTTMEVTNLKPEKDETYFVSMYINIVEANKILEKINVRTFMEEDIKEIK